MNSSHTQQDDSAENDQSFFAEFSASSYDEWRREVERLLKGAPFDKKMITKTDEGIMLQPLYRQEDINGLPHVSSFPGFAPFVRGSKSSKDSGNGWAIAQEINYPNAIQFNTALRHDFKRGLTVVNLPLDFASRTGCDPDTAKIGDVGYHGVSIATADELADTLAGIELDKTPVFIHAGSSGLPFLGFLIALAKQNNCRPETLSGAIAADPIGELAAYGKLPALIDQIIYEMAATTAWAIDHAPKLGTVWVHGEKFHNSGANAVQELAVSFATAVYYLRQLESKSIAPESAVSHFRFSLASGSHVFMEISKFRAARILWNRITEACGIPENKRGMWLHVESSHYNKTSYDPYVNMLRTTTEAFAGAIGGADSMHVAPFDDCLRAADEFSRRTARNTQVILSEESHLSHTIDPAGGSWYVEKLTAEIVDKAWELFCEIDNKGGIYQALKDGFIQEMVNESSRSKADAMASRRKIAIGTNIYANPTEQPLEPRDFDFESFHEQRSKEIAELRRNNSASINAANYRDLLKSTPAKLVSELITDASKGATLGDILAAVRGSNAIRVEMIPLPSQRQSVSFEMLRRKVEAFRNDGRNTKVFLATLGPVRKYMPRLDFAASFFEVGGFEVIRTTGFGTIDEAAKEALASGANAIVICGMDESYETDADKVASKIKAQNKDALIILAGKPASDDLQQRLEKAGISKFIHIKSNVLRELKEVAAGLGVQS
ncbi:MAG: methylmalonyl-CoA mutase family protein [Candidatus Zixiibacteriota bacterium]